MLWFYLAGGALCLFGTIELLFWLHTRRENKLIERLKKERPMMGRRGEKVFEKGWPK